MEKWQSICPLEEIPSLGARVVKSGAGKIALFRTGDDQVYALRDRCPHRGGPLSQGLVYDKMVSCCLHGWRISLETGIAEKPDEGVVQTYQVKVEEGQIFVKL